MPKPPRKHEKYLPMQSIHAFQHLCMVRGALQHARALRNYTKYLASLHEPYQESTRRWVGVYKRAEALYAQAIRLGFVDGNPRAFHNVHGVIVDARRHLGLTGMPVPNCAEALDTVEFEPPAHGESLAVVFDRQEAAFNNWAMAYDANNA